MGISLQKKGQYFIATSHLGPHTCHFQRDLSSKPHTSRPKRGNLYEGTQCDCQIRLAMVKLFQIPELVGMSTHKKTWYLPPTLFLFPICKKAYMLNQLKTISIWGKIWDLP